MIRLKRLAFIGNSLPRRCGIATFTTHLQQAVSASRPDLDVGIVAMTDQGHSYDYPPVVRFQIASDSIEEYVRAANCLNADRTDVVSLQQMMDCATSIDAKLQVQENEKKVSRGKQGDKVEVKSSMANTRRTQVSGGGMHSNKRDNFFLIGSD